MKRLLMKSLLALLFAALAVPLFAGGGAAQGSAASDGYVHRLSMLVNYNMTEPPSENTDLMKYMREVIKADLDISWYPTPVYNQTLAVRVSSNDLPDAAVSRGNGRDPVVVQAVRDGMFWDIGKYLNNPAYPGLAKINQTRVINSRIDGKSYGIPIERELVQAGVMYRQDWLDKLGLQPPKNMNDIWNIIKAFSERDPNGDGRAVTGLSTPQRMLRIDHAAVYFGGGYRWYWDEATKTVRHETEHPAFWQSLDFHRNAYAQKYFVQDVPEIVDEILPFSQGRAGLMFFSDFNDVVSTELAVKNVFPEARMGFSIGLETPDGQLVNFGHIGYNGTFMFSRTSIKDEARLEQVMKFFDALGSDDAILTMRRGIAGKHYTIENGTLVATDEQIKNFQERDFPDAQLLSPYGVTRIYPERFSYALTNNVFNAVINYKGKIVPQIEGLFISDTAVKAGRPLPLILEDANMRYILGAIDRRGYEAEIARWRQAGGDQVQKELTAAYVANPLN